MKLKHILILILITFSSSIFSGCSSHFFSSYLVKNNTGEDIRIIFYKKTTQTITIKNNETHLLASLNNINEMPVFTLDDNDSISFISDEKIVFTLRRYLPGDQGKNIYHTQNESIWKIKEIGRHNYQYTFEFDTTDIIFDSLPPTTATNPNMMRLEFRP